MLQSQFHHVLFDSSTKHATKYRVGVVSRNISGARNSGYRYPFSVVISHKAQHTFELDHTLPPPCSGRLTLAFDLVLVNLLLQQLVPSINAEPMQTGTYFNRVLLLPRHADFAYFT